MKQIVLLLLTSSIVFFCGFKGNDTIDDCYLTFIGDKDYNISETNRLPEGAEKYRVVKTDNGEVKTTRLDGYRILYKNEKGVPVVNMKVEISDPDSSQTDKTKLLANLDYLNRHSKGMETNALIERDINGFQVYGSSRGSVDEGATQSTFLIFVKNTVIYLYFNNLKPEYRNYANLTEYKKQRDNFISAFTKYLSSCK